MIEQQQQQQQQQQHRSAVAGNMQRKCGGLDM